MADHGACSYRRYLLGEEKALEEFVTAYSDGLVRFAYSIVRSSTAAEEIAADSIAKFLLKRKSFPDEPKMRAYLFKIARNRCLDHRRRSGREVPLEDVENVLGGSDPQMLFLQKARNAILYRGLQKLPKQYAAVLELKYLEGFDHAAICRILSLSSKQLYNCLSRAKASLKEILEKEGITHEDLC